MRITARIVAVFAIAVGIVGIVSPDVLTAARREYFATSEGLYTAAAVRVVMGIVVMLVAPTSRAPRTVRLLGALACLQALSAMFIGPNRARSVLEWEAMQGTGLLRLGASVSLLVGAFLAFAVAGRRPSVYSRP